jgi:hypothetical protein
MRPYQLAFLKSRWKAEGDNIRCEIPWCVEKATEVHHISCSYRWRRKHQEDGSDICALCRGHHNLVHSRNDFDTRTKLVELVQHLLDKIKKTHEQVQFKESR